MPISDQLQVLAAILDQLTTIDFGYPLGTNAVAPPRSDSGAAIGAASLTSVPGLADLYSTCDGVSMPDVHVGYFIAPLAKVLDPTSEPHTILLEEEIPVLSIGSTGGGDLFVLHRETGEVLLLPPGPLHGGRYDGRTTQASVVAQDISTFFERLIQDAAAFIDDDRGHPYITDC